MADQGLTIGLRQLLRGLVDMATGLTILMETRTLPHCQPRPSATMGDESCGDDSECVLVHEYYTPSHCLGAHTRDLTIYGLVPIKWLFHEAQAMVDREYHLTTSRLQ